MEVNEMKSKKIQNTSFDMMFFVSVCLIIILLFGYFFEIKAEGEKSTKINTGNNSVTGSPVYKKFNINDISTWIKNDGESDINPNGNSGFEYPRTSGKTAIFQSGLLWGGKVGGQVRVGGSVYRQGTVPGRILNSGVPANQLIGEDPNLDHVRCFRVRPDYQTAAFDQEIADGEGSHIEIFQAYERDWFGWPANDGAPFEDVDADGFYNPSVDIPGIPGADQTIWFVCNDTDPNQTQFMYGSLPMGIEEQVTVWGYNSAGPLGSMIFKRYVIINKSNSPLEEMYISIWNDPDVGDASDDFVGCDTVISLTYAYNANPLDLIYGNQPPAAGFDFLQGPIVPGNPTDTARYFDRYVLGKKNLPVSAHYFFVGADALWRDPVQGQYQGTLEWYNYLQGKLGSTGDPFPDPYTGGTTKFALYGDPVAGTGWIDGLLHAPGDRRAGLSTGPFTIPPGDTQEVVIATVVSIGSNHLQSITLLKFYDLTAKQKYNNFFNITGVEANNFSNLLEYELFQNYPNPFNPSTKIKYQIPDQVRNDNRLVTLKVYDVLGNEIATLVNEEKQPGTYEVEFNITSHSGEVRNLSSGIYFYQLKAGNYIETKKMLLLK
jgi:hypothetical protein